MRRTGANARFDRTSYRWTSRHAAARGGHALLIDGGYPRSRRHPHSRRGHEPTCRRRSPAAHCRRPRRRPHRRPHHHHPRHHRPHRRPHHHHPRRRHPHRHNPPLLHPRRRRPLRRRSLRPHPRRHRHAIRCVTLQERPRRCPARFLPSCRVRFSQTAVVLNVPGAVACRSACRQTHRTFELPAPVPAAIGWRTNSTFSRSLARRTYWSRACARTSLG
mmetsp:Transcript_28264/g.92666  ORF Transcript_28264/g.92666 Transcript_28264/m.92666 type:complete len:218 (+) Transcript_28264:751-1404(+)